MPVLVYDTGKLNIQNEDASHMETFPVFSAGHGKDSGKGHSEDHHDKDSHDSEQDGRGRPIALVPKEEIFMRHKLFPSKKYHRTFFVWATNERSYIIYVLYNG